ncbi:SUKH-4 family immunity protein [Nonomuraea zeae]|uniref:SUKH-4 immunity protein of toxin-antitoxin system n=1 Tax=Nonomuraea zeae TaxID=1642303 RepID=A0A5S4GMW8_9ACTN|nr:SUKH-4 family immunity protein [Nonomuraea zeae]TMR34142.1 hypothetical protein ETD85_17715 [Nonomuraea zeae]
MVTHEQMVELFGPEAVRLTEVEHLRDKGLSATDARILGQIGLPVRADLAFTTAVAGDPLPGSSMVFKTGGGDVDVLILGGTSGEGGMRYFLDLRGGVVGLLSLDGEPQAEKVNSDLESFVEFLYRLRVRQRALNGETEETARGYTERLWLSLKELDPAAFTEAEGWWPMVLDTLMDRDLIAETRAFLQQRRAEVAGELSGGSADRARRTQRDGFDQALSRLASEGWRTVDAARFAAESETSGLLSLPADLGDHFAPDGSLAKDVGIAWRGGLPSNVQSAFAREGLVVRVPGQAERDDEDALLELDPEELGRQADAAMEALFAAVHGLNKPEEGVVTCLATDRSSDLCEIVRAFERLAEHGYLAEPDLWPTASGAWQHVHETTAEGQAPKAVFWITQAHTSCFDPRGDLVEELAVQWAGDRELIAKVLSGSGLKVTIPPDDSVAFLISPATRRRLLR